MKRVVHSVTLAVLLFVCRGSAESLAQAVTHPALMPVAQTDRVTSVGTGQMVQIHGQRPSWANESAIATVPVEGAAPQHIVLLLQRSSAAQAAFEQLLADQQTPGSPLYHKAVTPEELGALYGPTVHDIEMLKNWARSEGLAIGTVSPTRMTLELRGTTSTVAAALRVHLSNFSTSHALLQAPDADPLLPAEFAPLVSAISGLTSEDARPEFTGSKGGHFITPADFATIYNVIPVYTSGNTGATIAGRAQHVAILGNSNVDPTDIQAYFAGIGNSRPNFNVLFANGTDPGFTAGEGEAELDIERVLGTAPGVVVDLVVGGSNTPLYDAAAYAVNTLKDPIVTVSFGECEPNLGQAQLKFWNDIWSTAAANMTSVFVSGGDSGAAACDAHDAQAPAQQQRAVNGFASTPYNVAVGGTEFNDSTNPGQYWSATNDPTTKGSALGYIPEGAWNDPVGTDSNGATIYLVRAGGGGASQYVSKPVWQTGSGVPADGHRDMPDISLSASAVHDPYYVCQRGKCTVAAQSMPSTFVAYGSGGTSASAPSMAAIAALLNTAAGAPQGNLNPTIYRLANSVVYSKVFHDVTLDSAGFTRCDLTTPSLCNNSTPAPNSLQGGQQGFAVGAGYDQATGWGSLDVTNFIKAAVPVSTTLQITASGTALSTAQSFTVSASLTANAQSLAAPTGTVQFYVNGVASGAAVALSGNAATSAAINLPSAGTYTLTAMYSGDALYAPATASSISVMVAAQAPTFTLSVPTTSLSFTSGATVGNSTSVSVAGVNNYAGQVGLTCMISSSSAVNQPTCSVSPTSVTLGLNGSASAMVTITSTTAHAALMPGALGERRAPVLVAGAGLFVFTLAFGLRPYQRTAYRLMVLFASVGASFFVAGCSSSRPATPLQSSAGTYTVTVTGAGTGAGALTTANATTTFTVVIQ